MKRMQPVKPATELPSDWIKMPSPFGVAPWQLFWMQIVPGSPKRGITVLLDCEEKTDGRLWLHASFSRVDRVPNWKDICLVKHLFIGDERKAIQVLPATENYVNIHPTCLHLWACLEGDPLPEFSAVLPGIGKTI